MASGNTSQVWYFGVGSTTAFLNPGMTVDRLNNDMKSDDPVALFLLKITKDAQGNFSQEISDADGKVIATRVYEDLGPKSSMNIIENRYEYDNQGRLIAEISPLENSGKVAKCRTTYEYDNLGRLLVKRTPDAAPTFYHYDDAGRDTLTTWDQDKIQTKYDKLGRVDSVVINGDLISKPYYNRLSDLDNEIRDAVVGKTDKAIYDKIITNSKYNPDRLTNLRGKSFASVSYTGVVDATEKVRYGRNGFQQIALASYDNEGRVKAAYSYFPPVGWKKVVNRYDLQGTILATEVFEGYNPSTSREPTTKTIFIYDHIGRLESIKNGLTGHKYVSYKYEDTGELKSKTLYAKNNSPLKTVNYSYNIRGWTKSIDAGEQFKEILDYTGNYTGNITSTEFHYNTGTNNFTTEQHYGYSNANRLRSVRAEAIGPKSAAYIDSLTEGFTYDENGRILTASRGKYKNPTNPYQVYARTWSYKYDPAGHNENSSHKLLGVAGYHDKSTGNYVYDPKGNMTVDYSKNMGVVYDYRNLPVLFEFYADDADANSKTRIAPEPVSTVQMVYDAGGNRIAKIETVNHTSRKVKKGTIYSGSMVYKAEGKPEDVALSYTLDYYTISDGRVARSEDGKSDSTRYFNLKDHLGSTRMTIAEDGSVAEADLYTAFGQEIVIENSGEETKAKFTTKEFDRDGAVVLAEGDTIHGIQMNYFGARYYDPIIGRWTAVDPKEQFWDRYAYAGNGFNPINGIDPDGRDMTFLLKNDAHGHMAYIIGNSDIGFRYFSQGANDPNASSASFLLGSEFNGGMSSAKVAGLVDMGLHDAKYAGKIGIAIDVSGELRILDMYDEAAVMSTTPSEDLDILLNSFKQISNLATGNEKYDLYKYNCADATLRAAKAGNLEIKDALTPKNVYKNVLKAGAEEQFK